MTRNLDDAPLNLANPDRIRAAGQVLRAAGYADARFRAVMGVPPEAPFQLTRQNLLELLAYLQANGTPLDALVRLFLAGLTVDRATAARAVQPMDLDDWIDLGLFVAAGAGVAAAVSLVTWQDLLLFTDLRTRSHHPDFVMSVSGTTALLNKLAMHRPVRAVLDLGTGCGIHALIAAAHAERVVATDLNPRACNFAAFNALVNGRANVTVTEGDLYQPVAGQTFDLIVANPPFIIAPGRQYLYLSGTDAGDGFSERVVRGAAAHLAEGGVAQVLCNWASLTGRPGRERVSAWLEGSGCDAWILESKVWKPVEYAAHWLRDSSGDDLAANLTAVADWKAYLAQLGIDAVTLGLITLRKRSAAAHWRRWDTLPEGSGPGGDTLARGIAAQDFLAAQADDQTLLQARFTFPPHLRLEQQRQPGKDGWPLALSRLRLAAGLAFWADVDPDTFQLLVFCGRGKRLRACLEDLALTLKQKPAAIIPRALPIVREFIAQGFLWPLGAEGKTP